MENWISKRELLEITGISYGQLYRWKREKLIPDNWFVKRSSYTGQETFLPRERAIERIRFILENKDGHSLQQLLELISPTSASREYRSGEIAGAVKNAGGPAEIMAKLIGGEAFNHAQALSVLIAADMLDIVPEVSEDELNQLLIALIEWQAGASIFEKTDGRLIVIGVNGGLIPLMIMPDARSLPREGIAVEYELALSDIPDRFTKKLNSIYEEAN